MTTEDYLHQWFEAMDLVDKRYKELIKAQSDYDVAEAKYYDQWVPKNWIQSKIIVENPELYKNIAKCKVALSEAKTISTKSERLYFTAKKENKETEEWDKQINSIYST